MADEQSTEERPFRRQRRITSSNLSAGAQPAVDREPAGPDGPEEPSEETSRLEASISAVSEFTRLLDYLKAARGFDFSAYKVSSLMRRIQKRMREVGSSSYAEYTDFLEVHPHEFEPLFDTVLINVTGFFRDPAAWQYLEEHAIPRILDEKESERPVRVWSAGCASGEEAYSVAMLLCEALGEEGYQRRVKIYATDLDEDALATARQGSYDARQLAGVSPERIENYFEPSGGRCTFRPGLRRNLIFGRHDLIQDAAISRIDLLLCRNTLMYFNSEAQEKILARFHFALKKTGFLFLGRAETLLAHGNSFKPVELKHRIFAPAPSATFRDRLLAFSSTGTPAADSVGNARQLRIRESSFESGPVAQIALDRRGCIALTNEKARRLFGIGNADLGRPVQDLELSYRPIELRSHIDEAHASQATVQVKDVEWRVPGAGLRRLEIHVVPLLDAGGTALGTSISFLDFTQAHQLRTDLERAHQELETAYEELQSANEELETTNEELQSTVEELETTNEELQSANEELETMNEELQSTNEDLRNINEQFQQRTDELNRVNGYLETILASLRSAVVVLDRSLQVQAWSEKAEGLWGLRGDEVRGKPFLALDIGLPVQELEAQLRECLLKPGERSIELSAVNRRGKPFRCRIRCTPLGREVLQGVILLMEDEAEDAD